MRGDAVFEKIDTVVVGGGQAGLAMSYHLKRLRYGAASGSVRCTRTPHPVG